MGDRDGERGVAVEDHFSAGEVADDPVQQGNKLVPAEEPHQAIGDDHGWPVSGDRRRSQSVVASRPRR